MDLADLWFVGFAPGSMLHALKRLTKRSEHSYGDKSKKPKMAYFGHIAGNGLYRRIRP